MRLSIHNSDNIYHLLNNYYVPSAMLSPLQTISFFLPSFFFNPHHSSEAGIIFHIQKGSVTYPGLHTKESETRTRSLDSLHSAAGAGGHSRSWGRGHQGGGFCLRGRERGIKESIRWWNLGGP